MDEAYSWHKGACGLNPKWPVPTPLLPDELFSSWISRIAFNQGCDPLTLTGSLWPGWRAWTVDMDRGISFERLSIISKISGIEESRIIKSTIKPVASTITEDLLDAASVWPWIMAVGSRNRRRYGGLQFCPQCLSENSSPYYRLHWRFAWHTYCIKHMIQLLDKCFTCNASIEPHRLSQSDKHIALCATCKNDLRSAVVIKQTFQSIVFQQLSDMVIKNKIGSYGHFKISPAEWFELSRLFVNLLRKASFQVNNRLKLFLVSLGVDINQITPSLTGLSLELLPVEERAVYFGGVIKLLEIPPAVFINQAKIMSIPSSAFYDYRRPISAFLEQLLHQIPKVKRKRKKLNKTKLKPRSSQAVLRMWERLKRKHRIQL